jgi:microcystin-dependent protein
MAYIGNEPSVNFTSFAKQDITGDGGASYTLTYAVANANEIEVFVNNVRQEPTVAYTVSGTALTMTGNVASTDDFYVIYLGKALQTTTPPDGSVTSAKIASSVIFVPSGIIMPFGGTSAPTGYLSCDGSAISRTTYSTLFTAIGTTWGTGDGSSTFNVPDLRASFLRGTGSHGSSTMANGSAFSAPSVGSFENDQFQSHFHDFNRGETNEAVASGTRMTHGNNGDAVSSTTNVGLPTTDTINSTGTPRNGDETRPFNASVLYVIKT